MEDPSLSENGNASSSFVLKNATAREKKRRVAPNGLSWRQNKLKKRKVKEKHTLAELDEKLAEQTKSATIDISVNELAEKSAALSRTVSIALPGSILNNAQSPELRTYLAGQIARAAAIYRVDEIIVYDETATLTKQQIEQFERNPSSLQDHSATTSCNFVLARILQYLETPQYLRKQLFPLQKELKFAGVLNPLDCAHHLRSDDLSIPYREAVVLSKPVKQTKPRSLVDAGLSKEVSIDRELQPGVRVTVKLDNTDLSQKKLRAKVVCTKEATQETGAYWGYTVRVVGSLSQVFRNCPHSLNACYDVTMGTSDKGLPVSSLSKANLQQFRHVLLVFGGLGGVEVGAEADESIPAVCPSKLFDHYLNTCSPQGSRTIRTEEAILISLAALRPYWENK